MSNESGSPYVRVTSEIDGAQSAYTGRRDLSACCIVAATVHRLRTQALDVVRGDVEGLGRSLASFQRNLEKFHVELNAFFNSDIHFWLLRPAAAVCSWLSVGWPIDQARAFVCQEHVCLCVRVTQSGCSAQFYTSSL